MIALRDTGLVADLCLPEAHGKRRGVIVIGGSKILEYHMP
jgi:hypothetical protein